MRILSFDKVVWEETLSLSDTGTLDGKFVLSEDAALGTYSLMVLNPFDESILGEVSFNVAEYRRPEFRVDVTVEPTQLVQGENGKALVKAEYYSGGAVANGKYRYTITAQPYVFTPGTDFAGHSFTDDELDNFDYTSREQGLQIVSEQEGGFRCERSSWD